MKIFLLQKAILPVNKSEKETVGVSFPLRLRVINASISLSLFIVTSNPILLKHLPYGRGKP